MINKKTDRDILTEVLAGIMQDTDITMVSKGSVTKAICSAFSRSLADAYQILDDVRKSAFLSTASGFYLDLFGETIGLPRILPSPGQVDRADNNVKFYVRSGRLADKFPHPTNLNLGRIPQGTQLSNLTGSVIYEVDNNYDFPASATETFVGVQSTSTGITQNVGVGELRILTSGTSGVLVVNLSEIGSAGDSESDAEYRFRLSKWITSSRGSNEASVRLAALSVPGVADIITQELFAGAGSFRVVLIPTGNRVPVGSLQAARNAVGATASYGIYHTVEEPRYIPISMSISLVGKSNSGPISTTARDKAEQAIRGYLGNIRPGGSLIINQLRRNILSSSDEIADLNISSLEINRRPMILSNFTLRQDELLVPDDSMNTPILLS